MNAITVRINTGSWVMSAMPARLVSMSGTSSLPSPIDYMGMEFHPANNIFMAPHPLVQQFPGLNVAKFIMAVKPNHIVERNGRAGVSLFVNYNQTDTVVASLCSENGRNPLGPWHWEQPTAEDMQKMTNEELQAKYGVDCNPAIRMWLENRWVFDPSDPHGIFRYRWQSYMIHGWKKEAGFDWRDGVVYAGSCMHGRSKGEVMQSILMPIDDPRSVGLGTAEQTMAADVLNKTLSYLLFEPRDNTLLPRHTTPSALYPASKANLEGTRSLEAAGEPESQFKMAAGGKISQHIIRDPFGVNFWKEQPHTLVVIYPMHEQAAFQLLNARSLAHQINPGRQTF